MKRANTKNRKGVLTKAQVGQITGIFEAVWGVWMGIFDTQRVLKGGINDRPWHFAHIPGFETTI